jgi:hypothetical protein
MVAMLELYGMGVVQRIVQSLLMYAMVHHVEVFQPVACFAFVDAPEGLPCSSNGSFSFICFCRTPVFMKLM